MSANFAMLIFCGHYPKQSRYADHVDFPEGMADGDCKLFSQTYNKLHVGVCFPLGRKIFDQMERDFFIYAKNALQQATQI